MAKRYVPRTLIVCTLGPASASETTIRKMTRAGMDIARFNLSHGNHTGHTNRLEAVRTVNRKYRRRVRVMADLEGPRIRLGHFKEANTVELEKNRKVSLVAGEGDGKRQLPIDYPGPLTDFEGAEHVYLDDGNIVLAVRRLTADCVDTKVVVGGVLKERKALNVPGARLTFPPVTEKDERDIVFAAENGFDFIAQSFVQTKEDVLEVRRRLAPVLPECRIIAKIENRQGVRNIAQIVEAADGIMIARGDMGVSLPIHEVPLIQKSIIRRCRDAGRMVITATQMLEHMVEYPIPTRAEVTDVANAVLDGTDCVMLSAETAAGKYPVETVAMMNRIISYTEQNAPPADANSREPQRHGGTEKKKR